MLTFLRKIRKSLIESGSGQKYLLYAVGEILLVMIGILLALQVNNWNEERKKSIDEKALLTQLTITVQSNLDHLEESKMIDYQTMSSINTLIFALENDLPYHDSIASHFYKSIGGKEAVFSTSALESIRSKGVDIIKYDSLRAMILDLFDMTYKTLEDMWEIDQTSFVNSETPIYMKNFRFMEGKYAIPKDYPSLLNDFEILSLLNWRLEIRRFSVLEKERAVGKSKDLIKEINAYIKSMEN